MNEATTHHHSPAPEPRIVAVLGLGPMGAALARSLVNAGHHTVVWNRTVKDLSSLGLDGAHLAAGPVEAVCDAEVVIVCVRNHQGSRPLIEQIAGRLKSGTPVVNLSTATSDQAVESAAAAAALGVPYVTGAIMVPTSLIGTDENLVFYAGDDEDIATATPILDGLGGTVDVLGADHALPPVLDMAMLDVFFAGMYAFLHSAAMVRAHGIEPSTYLPYANGILSTLTSELAGLARAFETRKYDNGQASLDMCLSFLNHIVATSESAGVDPRLPRLIRDATQEQADKGLDDIDWEYVAEGLT